MPRLLVALGLVFLLAENGWCQNQDESGWVNVLEQVQPDQATAGTWRKVDGTLSVDAAAGARTQLPVHPPREYDFRVAFTRNSGGHSIALIFVSGEGQATFDIDGWGQHLAGIQSIAGRDLRSLPDRATDIPLENGRRYTALLEVRENTVRCFLEGRLLMTYAGKGADLRMLDLWRIPDRQALGIGAWDASTTFHSIEVRNHAGASATAAPTERDDGSMPARAPIPMTFASPAPVSQSSAGDDLSSLSDEFDAPASLRNWRQVFEVEQMGADQLERIDIGRSRAGRLTMIPYTSSWYQDWRGVLLHKLIEGDFMATTQVRATSRNGQGPPQRTFSLAGIMIRTPRNVTPQTWRPGGENYIFLSHGAANQAGTYQFEVKTTVDSRSNLQITASNGPEEEIRAARVGASFILLRKNSQGRWTVHQRYHRPDMPAELQVGMTVYTDWPNVQSVQPEVHNRTVIRNGRPDLVATFDYFRFRRPVVPDRLRGRNLADPSQVSDQELLSFLSGD